MKLHTIKLMTSLIFLTLIFNSKAQNIVNENYDILIKNGIVIDGTGSIGFSADVLVKNDKIVSVGNVDISNKNVNLIIDAKGKIVSPGFIDSHAHGNPIKTPEFKNFFGMGVTTIFLGQDGVSAANISKWMQKVEEAKPAINIGTLVGHGTIRDEAGVKLDPNPTKEDIKQMVNLVDEAMEAGAFGLSTGLEYQPGSFSKLDEIIAIAKPVGIRGGIVHSHIRNEDDDVIDESIKELIQQGKKGECAVQVSHIKVTFGHGKKRAKEVIAQMEKARNDGIAITADIYPYTASYTGIAIVFPDWAKPPYIYEDVVSERREALAEYLRKRITLRNGPESTLFGTAPWAGKTLAEVATELGKPFEDVLIDDIGPKGASAAYFVMDSELQDQLFIDPYVMVCTDGSPTMRHPRGYGSFAKVIRYYVRETKMLKLEEAVRKMTGLPAETIGLLKQKRGLIKPGFAADILIFDPQKVIDKATFENPHQLAEGFDYVIVNGILVKDGGDFTGNRGGKVLIKN